MQSLRKFSIMTAMVSGILMFSGCAVYPAQHGKGYGPPSHAPAHGYRYNHQGHDVVYDSDLGVYIVVGLQDYYLYDNYYYRYDRNHWYYSQDIDKGWRNYKEDKLPPGLAKKYGHGEKNRGNRNSDKDNYNGNNRDH